MSDNALKIVDLENRLQKAEHLIGVQTAVLTNMQAQFVHLHGLVSDMIGARTRAKIIAPPKPTLVALK